MTSRILIVSTLFLFQTVTAQTTSVTPATSETVALPPTTPSSTLTTSAQLSPATPAAEGVSSSSQVAIMDYKGVFESATLEEELKVATERFSLTPAQQDVWSKAAADRRDVERKGRERLESKDQSYTKEAVYRGIRDAQNTFHETIIGYLSPAQKQGLEYDRLIMNEKRIRLAKLPPPPPPAPTPTVAPVDSSAIKAAEKPKAAGKKGKKKKQDVSQ